MKIGKAAVLALLVVAAYLAVASASPEPPSHAVPKGLATLKSNRKLLYYGYGGWGRSGYGYNSYPYTWQRYGLFNPPNIPDSNRMDTSSDRRWAMISRR